MRLEKQIADLRALREDGGGKLQERDRRQLEELERTVEGIRGARAKVGGYEGGKQAGEGRGGGQRGSGSERGGGAHVRGRGSHGGLGKRAREEEDSGSETDESVRRIPMPRDTPPPIPSSHRRHHPSSNHPKNHSHTPAQGTNASTEPLNPARNLDLPPKPTTQPKTTYSSAPQIRDLRKEAVAFMPTVVARKVQAAKGEPGRLMSEEEVEGLEGSGYWGRGGPREERGSGSEDWGLGAGGETHDDGKGRATGRGTGEGQGNEEWRRLEEEEARFSREVRMEEVSDEDL